jgi:hypothetical protein
LAARPPTCRQNANGFQRALSNERTTIPANFSGVAVGGIDQNELSSDDQVVGQGQGDDVRNSEKISRGDRNRRYSNLDDYHI